MISPARILVYRLGSLGDIVITLPCLRFIRETYPAAHITLLTNEPVSGKAAPAVSILEGSGLCDEYMAYPVGMRNVRRILSLATQIHREGFDLVINLAAARGLLASVRDDCFFRLCGIRRVIGTPFSRDNLSLVMSTSKLFLSEAQRLLNRISVLGEFDMSLLRNWDLNYTPKEKEEGDEILRKAGISGEFITASCGTKQPMKEWGEANWEKLFQLLGEHPSGVPLVLFGVASEASVSDRVSRFWPHKVVNLCGVTSPRVTGVIMSKSRLFIGHDSGPMHLAAASGTGVVAIFAGNNPPGQWYPGHIGWQNMHVFYPDLPSDGWNELYRTTRPNGMKLASPKEVSAVILEML
jgi:heptosyltransferase III